MLPHAGLGRQAASHRELVDYIGRVEVLIGENLGDDHEYPVARCPKDYLARLAAVENCRVISEVIPACECL